MLQIEVYSYSAENSRLFQDRVDFLKRNHTFWIFYRILFTKFNTENILFYHLSWNKMSHFRNMFNKNWIVEIYNFCTTLKSNVFSDIPLIQWYASDNKFSTRSQQTSQNSSNIQIIFDTLRCTNKTVFSSAILSITGQERNSKYHTIFHEYWLNIILFEKYE